tara:strand:+ start:251 stop:589 length:339 start_codon:yes stop_codon:yes gene_type:complete
MANDFISKTATSLAIDSGTYTTLYTAPATKTSIILEVDIANKYSTDITVNVLISDSSGGNDAFIVKEAPIPLGGALKVVSGQKIVLETGDALKAATSVATGADAVVSILEDV